MLITVPFSIYNRCLLKEDQIVDFDTPFLFGKKIEEEINISVAKELGIPSQKIFTYLKKFVGESIEKDETIAVKKGFFSNKKITSRYSGLIKEINHFDGSITILSRTKIDTTIKAFFKGKVNKISKNQVTVDINKGEEFSAKNVSLSFGGKTFYSGVGNDFTSENLLGSVVICENMTAYQKTKAEALGCTGFLSLNKLEGQSDAPSAQFKNINDYKKAVKLKFSYCTLVSESSIIYFYQ